MPGKFDRRDTAISLYETNISDIRKLAAGQRNVWRISLRSDDKFIGPLTRHMQILFEINSPLEFQSLSDVEEYGV